MIGSYKEILLQFLHNIQAIKNPDLLTFSSLSFLFYFFPIFLIIYILTPKKYRNIPLFLGSILLYAFGEPCYVVLLFFAVVFNYILGHFVWKKDYYRKADRKNLKIWIIIAVIGDVFLLVYFKLMHAGQESLLLPLGISFFTFKMISYQVDIYKRKLSMEPTFLKTAVYFCMFPQLVSGPIMRYTEAEKALKARKYTWVQLEEGLRYFVLGLGAKVLLADRISLLWNDIRTIGYESISTPLAWLGAYAYSLQIYFDFAGYSLMAAGICVMLGFPFIENFRHPYAALGIRDFFKRWHITLGTWFRDYVYIPLGGNQKGKIRTTYNLLIVWLLTGLWHGINFNFILWGLTLWLCIVLEKTCFKGCFKRYPVIAHCYVLFIIPLTWIMFALKDTGDLLTYFGRMFPFLSGAGIAVNQSDVIKMLQTYGVIIVAGVICCVPAVYRFYQKWEKKWVTAIFLTAIFWGCIYFLANAVNNPFLYFVF